MIEEETAKRVEEELAKRVQQLLYERKDEIEAEVLRRVEEAKKVGLVGCVVYGWSHQCHPHSGKVLVQIPQPCQLSGVACDFRDPLPINTLRLFTFILSIMFIAHSLEIVSSVRFLFPCYRLHLASLMPWNENKEKVTSLVVKPNTRRNHVM